VPNRLAFLQSIPKDAKIIIFSNLFRSFSSALLAVSFPIYLSKIEVSAVLIGLTFMGVNLFSAIRSLVEGVVADRIGRKPILIFIAASLVVGGAIFVTTTNITVLLVTAVLFTVEGTITYTPAEVALLGDKVSDYLIVDRAPKAFIRLCANQPGKILSDLERSHPTAQPARNCATTTTQKLKLTSSNSK
jgi:MFS family permease